jgi:hypothetical protein
MRGFRDAVEYCRMTDLGFSGLPYTWDNRQHGANNIKVCLYRGLGDDRFIEFFYNTIVQHIQTTESDYCAILCTITRSNWLQGKASTRPFRYENMWSQHERYNASVERAWQPSGIGLAGVQESLGRLQQALQIWSREDFGSVWKKPKTL